jgi:hypothetical protein
MFNGMQFHNDNKNSGGGIGILCFVKIKGLEIGLEYTQKT